MPFTHLYSEPVIPAGITPDRVVHDPERLPVIGNPTRHRRAPLIPAASAIRPIAAFESAQLFVPPNCMTRYLNTCDSLCIVGVVSSVQSMAGRIKRAKYRCYTVFHIIYSQFQSLPHLGWVCAIKGSSYTSPDIRLLFRYRRLDQPSYLPCAVVRRFILRITTSRF